MPERQTVHPNERTNEWMNEWVNGQSQQQTNGNLLAINKQISHAHLAQTARWEYAWQDQNQFQKRLPQIPKQISQQIPKKTNHLETWVWKYSKLQAANTTAYTWCQNLAINIYDFVHKSNDLRATPLMVIYGAFMLISTSDMPAVIWQFFDNPISELVSRPLICLWLIYAHGWCCFFGFRETQNQKPSMEHPSVC